MINIMDGVERGVFRPAPPRVHVKLMPDNVITLEAGGKLFVKELKDMLVPETGYSSRDQQLVFGDRVLRGWETLEGCGIQNNDYIELIRLVCGG